MFYMKVAAAAYGIISCLILYNQYASNSHEELFQKIVNEQLEGKLSENARVISEINARLGTLDSKMVTHDQLQVHGKALISELDEKTKGQVQEYMDKTGAKLDMMSRSYRSLQAKLDQGFSNLKASLPPPDWEGVNSQETEWCRGNPSSCAPLPFSWASNGKNKEGKPIARFWSENLWENVFQLDLDLVFKVVTIGYREDPNDKESGVVRNQGLHIYAGYIDDTGSFVSLSESELIEGDPNLPAHLFYSPTKVLEKPGKKRTFEMTFLAGGSYQFGSGLSALGALQFLNLLEGRLRFGGALAYNLNKSELSAGPSATWHMIFLGKEINISPMIGYLWTVSGTGYPTLGLVLKIW